MSLEVGRVAHSITDPVSEMIGPEPTTESEDSGTTEMPQGEEDFLLNGELFELGDLQGVLADVHMVDISQEAFIDVESGSYINWAPEIDTELALGVLLI